MRLRITIQVLIFFIVAAIILSSFYFNLMKNKKLNPSQTTREALKSGNSQIIKRVLMIK